MPLLVVLPAPTLLPPRALAILAPLVRPSAPLVPCHGARLARSGTPSEAAIRVDAPATCPRTRPVLLDAVDDAVREALAVQSPIAVRESESGEVTPPIPQIPSHVAPPRAPRPRRLVSDDAIHAVRPPCMAA